MSNYVDHLLSCAHETAFNAHELPSRSHEMLSRAYDMFFLHVPSCLLFSSLISGSAFSGYVVFMEIIINCARTFKSMPVPNSSTPQLPTAMMSQESADSSNLTQTELSF